MKCRTFVDFLMAYIEEELPDEERARFEEHMADCPPCVTYLESYKKTVEMGKSLCCGPDEEVPADVPENLIQAILKAKKKN